MNLNPSKIFDNFKDFMWKNYSKDGGKMLIHMGALGWFIASGAQLIALITNKKIDKEDKKFLIPQEAADGIVNFSMFYALTDTTQRIITKAVEKGKITNPEITNIINKIAKSNNTSANELLKTKNISDLLTDAQDKKLFKQFKGGVDIITTIMASVVACNIVTPIVRNKIASLIKNRNDKKKLNNEPDNNPIDENNKFKTTYPIEKPLASNQVQPLNFKGKYINKNHYDSMKI